MSLHTHYRSHCSKFATSKMLPFSVKVVSIHSALTDLILFFISCWFSWGQAAIVLSVLMYGIAVPAPRLKCVWEVTEALVYWGIFQLMVFASLGFFPSPELFWFFFVYNSVSFKYKTVQFSQNSYRGQIIHCVIFQNPVSSVTCKLTLSLSLSRIQTLVFTLTQTHAAMQ